MQEEESDSKSDILEESIHFEYDLLEFQFEPKSQSSTPRDCKTYLYALKCYICNLEFASDVERMQHFKIIHPPSKLANLSFESSMVRCRICKSTVSADAVPLNKHYRTHFETMNLLCSFCGKANFETASKYNLHLKKHKSDKYEIEFVKKLLQEESPIIHEPIIEIISDQISLGPPKEAAKKQISEKYLCELCGQKDFKYKKLYTLHLRQHNDKRRSENKVSKKFKS